MIRQDTAQKMAQARVDKKLTGLSANGATPSKVPVHVRPEKFKQLLLELLARLELEGRVQGVALKMVLVHILDCPWSCEHPDVEIFKEPLEGCSLLRFDCRNVSR